MGGADNPVGPDPVGVGSVEFESPVVGARRAPRPDRGAAGSGRRTGAVRPVAPDPFEDAVPAPQATPDSRTGTALKLVKGYPPVLGIMLVIDGVVAMIVGAAAAVSLGEAVTYLVLPPLAMLVVGFTAPGRRPRVPVVVGAAGAAAALVAALFLGGAVRLGSFPAWAETLAGAALLALGAATLVPRPARGRRRAPPRRRRP